MGIEPSLLKKILSQHPRDIEIFKKEGIIQGEFGDIQHPHAPGEMAENLYAVSVLKQEIIDDLDALNLKDLEISPGKYRLLVDALGNVNQAAKILGLDNFGIKELPDGKYQMDGHEAATLITLPTFSEALAQFTEKLASDLNEKLQLPGVIYFGLDGKLDPGMDQDLAAGGNFNLYYGFSTENLKDLAAVGIEFTDSPLQPQVLDVFPNVPPEQATRAATPEAHRAALPFPGPEIDPTLVPTPTAQPKNTPAVSSFDEILAALEEEGCHDIARKLHFILREKDN